MATASGDGATSVIVMRSRPTGVRGGRQHSVPARHRPTPTRRPQVKPVATHPGTASAPGLRLNTGTKAVRDYVGHLDQRREKVLDEVRGVTPLYSYAYVLNGFAAELTAHQAIPGGPHSGCRVTEAQGAPAASVVGALMCHDVLPCGTRPTPSVLVATSFFSVHLIDTIHHRS
jgi:hypothetical protein